MAKAKRKHPRRLTDKDWKRIRDVLLRDVFTLARKVPPKK